MFVIYVCCGIFCFYLLCVLRRIYSVKRKLEKRFSREKFNGEEVQLSDIGKDVKNDNLDGFNLSHYWYPVAFSDDITSSDIHPIKLFGEPLVLYRDRRHKIVCALDLCPHRSTPLSLGKMIDKGVLECRYHGWQFSDSGRCVKIPSLKKCTLLHHQVNLKCKVSHEEMGMVWVWAGDPQMADAEKQIPRFLFREYGQKEWAIQEGKRYTLPLDYALMIENLLDIAHVNFVHHGTIGNRRKAGYTRMCQEPSHSSIYKNRCHPNSLSFTVTTPETEKSKLVSVNFIPPCFVRLDRDFSGKGTMHFNQLFMCIPTDKDEMRLIFMFFRNFASNPLYSYLIPPMDYLLDRMAQKVIQQDLDLLQSLSRNIKIHKAPILGSVNVSADDAVRKYREFKITCERNCDPYFKGWKVESNHYYTLFRDQEEEEDQARNETRMSDLEDIEDLCS